MKKIVELRIDQEDLEFEGLGVDIMSLVDNPAIGVDWMAFADESELEEEFASYMDYPQAVKDNARKGIELNEEVDNECATQVGKEALKWAEGKVQEIAQEKRLAIAASDEFGEEYDEDTVIIDGTKEKFENIGDWLKGVQALDILGKRIKKDTSETKYRYAGPLAQRNFCKAMQRLRKLYTWEELKEMGRRVGNGMPVYGSSEFNIIDWKGGPNCKHYFEELVVFKRDGRAAMMISKGPASGQMGTTPYNSDNHGYKMSFQFADEDQRIIIGPAMIPQQLIARRDALGNIFHVYFTKETIKKIAEKFLRENKHNNTDVNHDDDITVNNTLLESWIVEDTEYDKSAKYGYNVPEGTWMVSYKINDEETWQKIKEGALKGFSVAGNFIEKAVNKL